MRLCLCVQCVETGAVWDYGAISAGTSPNAAMAGHSGKYKKFLECWCNIELSNAVAGSASESLRFACARWCMEVCAGVHVCACERVTLASYIVACCSVAFVKREGCLFTFPPSSGSSPLGWRDR